jgi:acyl transferase domain-containing protein
MTSAPHDELLDHARRIIRDLRSRLAAAEALRRQEPIAIIGMAFRFPGAGSDPDKLWRMFVEGRDAVGPVPADRWNAEEFFDSDPATPAKMNTTRAAFLDDVRRFDAAFFDITPREAVRMDPQQRLFLETAWHALEDAGLPKEQIAGGETGVFVGVHNHSSDYQAMQFGNLEKLDAWSATGTAHDMIAGRLAYWLDLHGPAIAINTACSSSLAAVHLACRCLRAGDCATAVAAGVNLLLTPGSTVAASQLQLLSPDGHCRTFDARAQGMGRGEGCGVVVLKKLSAAQQAGDRVLAVIRGSAINQDGRTNGLTAPNGLAQQRVIVQALAEAGVQPGEVDYIETHGTGTALGDPIEVESIAAVFGGEGRKAPCTLGAVKANLGHLEGAAGLAGLIKVVMVLRHGWIPPVANLQQLNPHIAVDSTGLDIPLNGRAWPANRTRIAGISSFGWSGTNVHVVLEEASAVPRLSAGHGPWPVVVSAQTPEALRQLAERFAEHLDSADPTELGAISYTSAVRRTAHPCRVAVLGNQAQEIARRLRERIIARDLRNGRVPQQDERLSRWENGGDVEWSTFFPEPLGVVDLPPYPFQGKDYWIEEKPIPVASRPKEGQNSLSGTRAETSAPDEWFYSVKVVEQDLGVRGAPRSQERPTWILLGREAELGRELASAIRSRGEEVMEGFGWRARHSGVAPEKWLAEIVSRRAGNGPCYLAYFPENDAPSELTADALRLVQALLRCEGSAQLWFVMEVSTKPTSTNGPISSALHGFSRVAGLEHPSRVRGLISADAASALQVIEEIDGDAGDDNILLRAGRRWVPRLDREKLRFNATLQLREDRSYLVTGAFGAIGMDVADWLVAAGARHLVLAGRREPSAMGKPQLLKRLDAMRVSGIDVRTVVCDVADPSQVTEMLKSIDASGTPLAGLIHAAAGLRFSPVEEVSAEDVQEVFRAKLESAQVLDLSTRERSLDFFVLFSSAAATVGLRNGAVYAAANSALPGVVEERRALGLPALCVEWGSLASDHEGAQSVLVENSGFISMPPQLALSCLAALIQEGRTRGIVADVDWQTLGPAMALRGRDALVSKVLSEADERKIGNGNVVAAAWVDTLRSQPTAEQQEQLLAMVVEEARGIFGMGPGDLLREDRGLFAMGMDSLMAVRLKRRLEQKTGLRLPGTVTLTYPTLTALAGYLQTQLFGEETEPVPPPAGAAQYRDQAKLAAMDHEQTHTAIEEELAAVQQTLARKRR